MNKASKIIVRSSIFLAVALFFLFIIVIIAHPVLAAAPTQGTPILNSTSGTNTTVENLTVYNITTADADNDAVKNIYNWYRNDTSITVLNMPFENNTANYVATTKDYSGYQNNGSITSAIFVPTGGYDGKGAYTFDGIDDKIEIGNKPELNLTTVNHSISLWFKAATRQNPTVSVQYIIYKYDGVTTAGISFFMLNSTKQVRFGEETEENTNSILMTAPTPYNDSLWHHAFIYTDVSGKNATMYIDGAVVATDTYTGTLQAYGASLFLGATFVPSAVFNGTLDDFTIYSNISFTDTQVKALYNNRTDLITSSIINGGERWNASITPNDGYSDGTTNYTTALTINTIPTIETPVFNVTTITKTSGIKTNTTYRDIDSHAGSVYFRWYRNWTEVFTDNYTNIPATTIVNSTLSTTLYSRSDLINVTVYANDGNVSSSTNFSATMLVANIAPTQGTPILNSTSGTNTTTENLTVYNITTADADGDAVKNIYNWYRNDTSITVLNMPFENSTANPASTTKDYSGYQNNGTITSAIWSATGGYDGKGAYTYDGIDDHIEIGTGVQLNLTTINHSFSLWFKAASRQNPVYVLHNLIYKWASPTTAGFQLFILNNTKQLRFQEGTEDDSNQILITTPSAYNDSLWHHAFIYVDVSGKNATFYIDGAVVGTDTYTGILQDFATSLRVSTCIGISCFFNGTIDEFVIYRNISFTDTQVKAIYDNRTDLITSSIINRGERWNASITPNDMSSDGTTGYSTALTINTIPTIETPVFNVTTVTKTSGVKANTTYRDADNHAGSVYFAWYRNWTEVFTDNYTSIPATTIVNSTLNTTFYNRSDLINVTVYANDGNVSSSLNFSATMTVANAAPTVETPVFNVTTVTKTSGIKTNTTYIDAESDAATVYFRWYRNWTEVFTDNYTNIPVNTIVNSTLNTTFYNRSDWINLTVYANDGTDNSSTSFSATMSVASIAPTQDTPTISSPSGLNQPTENLTAYNVSTADIDNDGVKNIYNWYRNDTSIAVLNMPFENNTANVASTTKDYSGYQNNGTVNGGTWLATAGYDGKGAYNFSGAGTNTIVIPNSPSLNISGNQITLEAWVRTSAAVNSQIIVREAGTSPDNFHYSLYISNVRMIDFRLQNSTGNVTLRTASSTYTLGSWAHIVATYNSTNMIIYRDAVQVAINNFTGNLVTKDADVYIGNYSNQLFNGTIDEVRIYNVSLTAEQVLAHYRNKTNTIAGSTPRNGTVLRANDKWNASVTPNDGFLDGTTKYTTSLTIVSVQPSVTISSPVDRLNTTNPNVTFQFTPSDDDSPLLCNATVDNTINSTNSSALNNVLTSLTGFGFSEGNHTWNITCTDTDGSENTTATRQFTVDTSIPNFHSLTYNPSTADALDPGVQIAFFAHVTDNFTVVDTVLLQYKLNTSATYTDVTPTFNTSNSRYEAAFTPTTNGTYNVRIFANDSISNVGQSSVTSIEVVNDRTWTRTPASVAVGTTPNLTISFVNITINNTADYSMNFTITTTYPQTYTFNTTFPLQLLSNETGTVHVTVTAPSTTGGTDFNFEINATPSGNPANRNTTATLAVTEGQPYLAATITSMPETARLTDTINITGRLQNIGTGNATTGTIFFTLPTNWNVTSGNQTYGFDELIVNADINSTISVNLLSTASTGIQTVKVNATGLNTSGANLVTLNSVSGSSDTITVSEAPAPLTGTRVPAGGAPGGAAGGAGPGGGGVGPAVAVGETKLSTAGSVGDLRTGRSMTEILETVETIYVVRSNASQFVINVTNIFNNSAMRDVNLSIEGYFAKYMSWIPAKISTILYNDTGQFFVTLAAPGYKKREEHNLTVTITSTVYAKYVDFIYNNVTGTKDTYVKQVKTKVIEKRNVTLIIIETTPESAEEKLQYGESMLSEFSERGLKTAKLSQLVSQMQQAYAGEQYAEVDRLYRKVKKLSESALEAIGILVEAKKRYKEGLDKGYNVEPLRVMIALADSALEREDFESALLRSRVAQLYQLIAIEQHFDLSEFVAKQWKLFLTLLILLAIGGYLTHRKIFLMTVDKKLSELVKEEKEIAALKELAQKLCFEEKKISILVFHKQMYHYEDRLSTIEREKERLQQKKEFLLTKESVLASLQKERDKILRFIREIETNYFILSRITKREFEQNLELYKTQLTELEQQISVVEAKIDKEANIKEIIKRRLTFAQFKIVLKEILHRRTIPAFQYCSDIFIYNYFVARDYIKRIVLFFEHIKRQKLALHIIGCMLIFGVLFAYSVHQYDHGTLYEYTGYAVAPAENPESESVSSEMSYERQLLLKQQQLYREIGEEEQFLLWKLLKEYWLQIIAGLIITSALWYIIRRKIFLMRVDSMLSELQKEEEEIEKLKLEAQQHCFKERKISLLIYHRKMYKYNERIGIIRRKMLEIERKKNILLTREDKIAFLKQQDARIIKELKDVQDAYFNKGKLLKGQYEEKSGLLVEQLMQNEKEAHALVMGMSNENYKYEKSLKDLEKFKKLQLKGLLSDVLRKDFTLGFKLVFRLLMIVLQFCMFFIKGWMKKALRLFFKMKKNKKKYAVYCLFLIFISLSILFFIFSITNNEKNNIINKIVGYAIISKERYIQHAEPPSVVQEEKEQLATAINRAEIEAKKNKTECITEQVFWEQYIRQNATTNVTEEDIQALLSTAEDIVLEMSEAGLSINYVEDLLLEMRDEANEIYVDYNEIEENAALITAAKNDAFFIMDMLALEEQEIHEFEQTTGLNATKAWSVYEEAESALAEERYNEAKEALNMITQTLDEIQVEAARLTTLLRAQKNKILEWTKENIVWIILFLVVFATIFIFFYKKIQIFLLKKRIENQTIEQMVLLDLIKKAQREYLVEGKISRNMMYMKTNKYKEDIEGLKASLPVLKEELDEKLHPKKVSILSSIPEYIQKYVHKIKDFVGKMKNIRIIKQEKIKQEKNAKVKEVKVKDVKVKEKKIIKPTIPIKIRLKKLYTKINNIPKNMVNKIKRLSNFKIIKRFIYYKIKKK